MILHSIYIFSLIFILVFIFSSLDHTVGLTLTWKRGPIYCSAITKRLLLSKYPNLELLTTGLEMNMPHWIYLDEEKTEGVTVTFFDANHILGAIMILFQGKIGTILHTGDFRYTNEMLNNNILFPLNLRNNQYRQIAIDIDHLILDRSSCLMPTPVSFIVM